MTTFLGVFSMFLACCASATLGCEYADHPDPVDVRILWIIISLFCTLAIILLRMSGIQSKED
jgi:hypothetical protein